MTGHPHSDKTTSAIRLRRVQLAVAFAAIGLFWCGVLPWIAAQPGMKQQLHFLEQRGIDPSAMFYTELEAMDAMDAILKKADGRTGEPQFNPSPGSDEAD